MSYELLSHLVLRLVVGSSMVIHAIYTLILYKSYLIKLDTCLSNLKLIDNEFFLVTATLFPMIEIILGSLIFSRIKKNIIDVITGIFLVFLLLTHYALGNLEIISVFFILLAGLFLVKIYIDNKKYKTMYTKQRLE